MKYMYKTQEWFILVWQHLTTNLFAETKAATCWPGTGYSAAPQITSQGGPDFLYWTEVQWGLKNESCTQRPAHEKPWETMRNHEKQWETENTTNQKAWHVGSAQAQSQVRKKDRSISNRIIIIVIYIYIWIVKSRKGCTWISSKQL